jgi:hypothetical protein
MPTFVLLLLLVGVVGVVGVVVEVVVNNYYKFYIHGVVPQYVINGMY